MKNTFLTKFENILVLRSLAKETAEKTFLHTSASNNATLIIAYLQSRYDGVRYVSTGEIATVMNQSLPNVTRHLNNLWIGGFIKRKQMPKAFGRKGRRAFGWSAKP